MNPAVLLLAFALAPVGQDSAGLLIRNGRVIDGTGAAPRAADVRIAGGEIVAIAPGLEPRAGERVIDAGGRVVAPGFIDLHSHADRQATEHPLAESQVRQGITTAVGGADGGSALPVSRFLSGVEAVGTAINYATLIGHGTVRSAVLGEDFRRAPTRPELEAMKLLVERGMLDGAFGLSSGLEYDPGFEATTDELVALAEVVAPYGGIYASHVRDEENRTVEAWSEAIEVGRRAGVPVHISHMKLAVRPVWGTAPQALEVIEAARADGVEVTGDWYPYTYWQSAMYVLIPERVFDDAAMWREGIAEIGGPQNVLIVSYPPDAALNGRTLAELAEERGVPAEQLVVDLVARAGPGIGIIGTSMDERDMEAIFAAPFVRVASDGAIAGAHPRGYGAFPRVLAEYVRERGLLPLEQAIAKMTGLSARVVGLEDRGVLAPGMKADVVVFDPARVQDRATKLEPHLHSEGIDWVIVNGVPVLAEGELTGARPGRALRAR